MFRACARASYLGALAYIALSSDVDVHMCIDHYLAGMAGAPSFPVA